MMFFKITAALVALLLVGSFLLKQSPYPSFLDPYERDLDPYERDGFTLLKRSPKLREFILGHSVIIGAQAEVSLSWLEDGVRFYSYHRSIMGAGLGILTPQGIITAGHIAKPFLEYPEELAKAAKEREMEAEINSMELFAWPLDSKTGLVSENRKIPVSIVCVEYSEHSDIAVLKLYSAVIYLPLSSCDGELKAIISASDTIFINPGPLSKGSVLFSLILLRGIFDPPDAFYQSPNIQFMIGKLAAPDSVNNNLAWFGTFFKPFDYGASGGLVVSLTSEGMEIMGIHIKFITFSEYDFQKDPPAITGVAQKILRR